MPVPGTCDSVLATQVATMQRWVAFCIWLINTTLEIIPPYATFKQPCSGWIMELMLRKPACFYVAPMTLRVEMLK
jgi:hypothetical protein